MGLRLQTTPSPPLSRRRGGTDQPLAGVPKSPGSVDKSSRKSKSPSRGRKESQMIQTLAARIQLAKMRAEDGQALVEYALIISLIAVAAIVMLRLVGTNVNNILSDI